MFIYKVKGLRMETNVDTQRIVLTEVETSVNVVDLQMLKENVLCM